MTLTRTGASIFHAVAPGVAVNISAPCLQESGLVDTVLTLVAASWLPPEQLTLEITESSVMSDTHRTLGGLHRLAASGLRLAIDDFGTGYPSLAYLQQPPVHELKVDRSFVCDMGTHDSNRAIVQSVVDLGPQPGPSRRRQGRRGRARLGPADAARLRSRPRATC